MTQAIRSHRVVTADGVGPACVFFKDGIITSIAPHSVAPADVPAANILDIGDRFLLPGLIDTHVHINEPGRTHWEGFATATRAAAASGITCLVDMPLNSIPSTVDVASLKQKRAAALNQCSVDVAFWGGLVPTNRNQILPLIDAGVRGFKVFLVHPGTEEFAMVAEPELRAAMPALAAAGLPLLAHAEDPVAVFAATPGRAYLDYLASRPEAAETAAVDLLIRLCRETGCRVHVVHLASAAALPVIRQARAEGLSFTVETCPHYLYFAAEDIPDGATQFKCAPPIRSTANRDLLWDALCAGDIDMVASDHSPCPPNLKCAVEGDFSRAWGGIASLSLGLPVIFTAALRHGREPADSVFDIARWMSRRPAALAGLSASKGAITPGLDADFTIFNPAAQFRVTPDRLHFRHSISPYLGETLTGEVETTFLRGQRVFHRGAFYAPIIGRECP